MEQANPQLPTSNPQLPTRKLTRKQVRRVKKFGQFILAVLTVAMIWFIWEQGRADIFSTWQRQIKPYVASLFIPATATPTPVANPTQTPLPLATLISNLPLAKDLVVANTPTTTAEPIYLKVATGIDEGSLNLRIGPGTDYAIVTVLAEGQKLLLIGCRNDWVHVYVNKTTGFVYGEYLAENPCNP